MGPRPAVYYIPIEGGVIFLFTVIDLDSRAALTWGLSNTNYARFCVPRGGTGDGGEWRTGNLNTERGAQFSSAELTQPDLSRGVDVTAWPTLACQASKPPTSLYLAPQELCIKPMKVS